MLSVLLKAKSNRKTTYCDSVVIGKKKKKSVFVKSIKKNLV